MYCGSKRDVSECIAYQVQKKLEVDAASNVLMFLLLSRTGA